LQQLCNIPAIFEILQRCCNIVGMLCAIDWHHQRCEHLCATQSNSTILTYNVTEGEKVIIKIITMVTLSDSRALFLSDRLYRPLCWTRSALLKFIERVLVIQFGVSSISFGVSSSSRRSLHITVFIYAKWGHVVYVKNFFPPTFSIYDSMVHTTTVVTHVSSTNSRACEKIYFYVKTM